MARIEGSTKVHRYSAEFKLKAVKLSGLAGVLVQPIGAEAPEITARVQDPTGNVIGLFQQSSGS